MGEGDDLQVPPTVKGLNGLVKREGDIPISGGTYSDVWMGTCSGRKVALKALREVRTNAKKAVKVRSHKNSIRYYFNRMVQRFEKEVEVWSSLEHPNILPFIGIVTDIGNFLQIVSPWQDNGNLLE